MLFKKIEWRILLRVLVLFITLTAGSFLLVKGLYIYLVLLLPMIIYELVEFYRFHYKAHKELDQFVESFHYRDFSRYFDVKHASADIQPLRKGFNEINTTFKVISTDFMISCVNTLNSFCQAFDSVSSNASFTF